MKVGDRVEVIRDIYNTQSGDPEPEIGQTELLVEIGAEGTVSAVWWGRPDEDIGSVDVDYGDGNVVTSGVAGFLRRADQPAILKEMPKEMLCRFAAATLLAGGVLDSWAAYLTELDTEGNLEIPEPCVDKVAYLTGHLEGFLNYYIAGR